MISFYEISRLGKSIESESRLMVTRGWEEGGMGNEEVLFNGYSVSVWEDEKLRT